MKKLLLGLGTIAAVTAPVVSVVACVNNLKQKLPPLDMSNISKANLVTPDAITYMESNYHSDNKKVGISSTFRGWMIKEFSLVKVESGDGDYLKPYLHLPTYNKNTQTLYIRNSWKLDGKTGNYFLINNDNSDFKIGGDESAMMSDIIPIYKNIFSNQTFKGYYPSVVRYFINELQESLSSGAKSIAFDDLLCHFSGVMITNQFGESYLNRGLSPNEYKDFLQQRNSLKRGEFMIKGELESNRSLYHKVKWDGDRLAFDLNIYDDQQEIDKVSIINSKMLAFAKTRTELVSEITKMFNIDDEITI